MEACWQWCSDDGCYLAYEPSTSAEIEAAHSTHQKSISVRSGNHQIRIDLAELYQIVLPVPAGDASSKRKVRRWHPLEFAVPQTWDHMPADGEIHTVDVPESSVDWIKCSNVLHKFNRTKFRLVRLQRIQNLQCLRAYEAERTNLSKRRGPACLNEQYVLHGTKHTHPLEVAAREEGFLTEMTRESCFFGSGL